MNVPQFRSRPRAGSRGRPGARRPRGGRRPGAVQRPPGRGRDQHPARPAVRVRARGRHGPGDPPGTVHVRVPARRGPLEQHRRRDLSVHGGQRRHADGRRSPGRPCRRGRPASSTSWRPRPSRAARAGSPAPPGASSSSACTTSSPARPSAPSTGPSPTAGVDNRRPNAAGGVSWPPSKGPTGHR